MRKAQSFTQAVTQLLLIAVLGSVAATKGALTAVAGGTACKTTIAIVGDDAFCAATPAQPKVLRLAGAGKL